MNGAAGDGTSPVLELDGIDKSWGERPILTDASLTLPAGSVTFMGGANGAGKTTLLRIASGLIVADAGRVSLRGLDPENDRRDYQRLLGWLPAGSGGIYNRLTVEQNLDFWAAIALVPKRSRRPGIDSVLRRYDIAKLRRTRADRISMGERQRLRLAMTFLHSPQLVLLDEPHTSLDSESLERLGAALEELAAGGGAALWCAPELEEVGLPADRQLVIRDGRPVPC